MYGCRDSSENEVVNSTPTEQREDSSKVENKGDLVYKDQFMLEEDGIKISLPTGYKRVSAVEYQNYVESKFRGDVLTYYKTRLKQLRNMDGTLYIYLDEKRESILTVNTTPPLNINKENAQDLLSMVRSDHNKVEKATNRTYEKITARFSDLSEILILKAIYKIDGADLKSSRYAHSYIITTKDKTLYVNAETSTDMNFDPYIEKMKF